MNASRVGGIAPLLSRVIPVFILFRVRNLRHEFKHHGIGRLSIGGVKGILLIAGWTLTLIGGVLLAVFS